MAPKFIMILMGTDTGKEHRADPKTARVFQANLDDEIDGIALYRMLAETAEEREQREEEEAAREGEGQTKG